MKTAKETVDLTPRPTPRSKRAFDLAAAAALALAAAPLMAAVALAIKATSRGPVFFRQTRVGKDAIPFRVFKFRTMTDARDDNGNLLPDDVRLYGVGRLLRKTSLDELPQLFNVLRGNMSLVGPRPLLLRYYPYFTAHEQLRHSVLPGITGWAQVHGRNEASWDRRLAMDTWYVKHWTFSLDIRILVLTIRAVVLRRGVVLNPNAIMQDLDAERSLDSMGATSHEL